MSHPNSPIPSVDVLEADARLRAGDPPPLVVDVREVSEFGAVRIEGAALVPLSQFMVRFSELPRDRPLLVVCAAGSRSLAATAHLLRNGWPDVVNIAGGMDAWARAGLPVRRGPIQAGEGQVPS
jgi:rhodanese-related sulfurtransferase